MLSVLPKGAELIQQGEYSWYRFMPPAGMVDYDEVLREYELLVLEVLTKA